MDVPPFFLHRNWTTALPLAEQGSWNRAAEPGSLVELRQVLKGDEYLMDDSKSKIPQENSSRDLCGNPRASSGFRCEVS